jgi:hypothetical protein
VDQDTSAKLKQQGLFELLSAGFIGMQPVLGLYRVSPSEKKVFNTQCCPFDVQYFDQLCYSDLVVDYFQNHWSGSPEYAIIKQQ